MMAVCFSLRPRGTCLTTAFSRSFSLPVRYSPEECQQLMPSLQQRGWSYKIESHAKGRDLIEKTFLFPAFTDAFAFMTEVAFHAEHHCHHPEWFNVYNRVNVVLSTHDCGGLSKKDLDMSLIMDRIYAKHSAKA